MEDVSYHPGVQPLTVAPTFEVLRVRVSDQITRLKLLKMTISYMKGKRRKESEEW